ncbi:hypothetical protein RC74_09580 [Falsihalocynthiibacter arcticus]|uniref:Uncharacterized protein n=1 Tax=Falsihalocynthiibacter arcticus TaxID=1579316 RepID=A0A126UZK2_9RHOB|nr:hypothetical protein RC74_09580 [Falsihalocynthiibacter arcticus]
MPNKYNDPVNNLFQMESSRKKNRTIKFREFIALSEARKKIARSTDATRKIQRHIDQLCRKIKLEKNPRQRSIYLAYQNQLLAALAIHLRAEAN